MQTPVSLLRRTAPLAALDRWAVRTQQDACRNARVAATEAAHRRLERAEVEHYLALRAGSTTRATALG